MPDLSVQFDIAAPPQRVWDVISDVERWHEWTPSITRITRRGQGPLAIGHSAWVRQPKLPPALWKVTALEPGRGFTWVSAAPGLRVSGLHYVEPAPGGSRATLGLRYEGLFGPLLLRMTRTLTERYVALEAKGLKARSEDPNFRHDTA